MKHILLILFLFFCFFLYPKYVNAISLEVSNLPVSVEIGQEFSADIVFTCSGCGTSYLRGVFFSPESSTSYSGFTQNNSLEWINTGTPAGYFKVSSGSWTGQLKFKFDPEKSAGDYFFKVGRYTASGTGFSQVSGNSTITIVSTPTPTENPTETPTATPTPTSIPTPSPTSTKATYKINKAKDQDGQTLSGVKIYIDNQYTHHEDDEVFEFCDTCFCDNDKIVPCGYGEHTVKLTKTGFTNWSEQRNFSQGTNNETTPILTKIPESTPTQTPTSTTTTPSPAKTPTPTPAPNVAEGEVGSTLSAVLGDSTDSVDIVIARSASDATLPAGRQESTTQIKKSFNYKTTFFIGLIVSASSGALLYFRHRKD